MVTEKTDRPKPYKKDLAKLQRTGEWTNSIRERRELLQEKGGGETIRRLEEADLLVQRDTLATADQALGLIFPCILLRDSLGLF